MTASYGVTAWTASSSCTSTVNPAARSSTPMAAAMLAVAPILVA
ncbi:hypothetical protein PWY87_25395 [Kribbella solani]|nr:hypothetical protein [Kribbella solani]MDX3005037.1 hypothetical protein [Kribbella solani]